MKFGAVSLGLVVGYVRADILKRRKKYPSRKEFRHFIDVPYLDDKNKHHAYDVYLADESNRKHCCIIDIHGGSYVFGDHIDNYPYAYVLLKMGYDVVLVDYKPNNGRMDISDLVKDCVSNINHLVANLDKYDLLKDKFVLNGDSAGGHLALLLSLAYQDNKVKEALDIELKHLDIISTVISCPVYNYTEVGEGMMNNIALKRMKGPKYNDKEHLNRYSPHTYMHSNELPLLVTTSSFDFIRNESLMLNEDMKNKDNYEFFDLVTENKKADHVHNVTKPNLKESIIVNNKIDEFIAKYL